MDDLIDESAIHSTLSERVKHAAFNKTPVNIRAGGTKDFYGNSACGELLDPSALTGIVSYEPSELVITARCGAPLVQIEARLAAQQQMLAFEPPHFGETTTLGGCIAAGLAGPRRAGTGFAAGSVRDSVLGCKLLDGRGEVLSFGGTVIKNVAGYDVSRVIAGSLGLLGVILEVSLKVVPKPECEQTLRFECDQVMALYRMSSWAARPYPISASAWSANTLTVRISGAATAVRQTCRQLGGEPVESSTAELWWRDLREQRLDFFASPLPLWRFSVPASIGPLVFDGEQMVEWGGAQRWLHTALASSEIRQRIVDKGGHATLFRGEDQREVFTPLAPALARIHQRLKQEFDPAGIFNPGRMYPDL